MGIFSDLISGGKVVLTRKKDVGEKESGILKSLFNIITTNDKNASTEVEHWKTRTMSIRSELCGEKTRQKAKETMDKVSHLKQENEVLEERIKLLHKELVFLKDIFMTHAGSKHGITVEDLEIKNLLAEDDLDDKDF